MALSPNKLKVSSVLGVNGAPVKTWRSRHLTHPGCSSLPPLLPFLLSSGLHPLHTDTMLLGHDQWTPPAMAEIFRWANSSLPTDSVPCVLLSIVGIRANNFQPLTSASWLPTIFPLCLSLSLSTHEGTAPPQSAPGKCGATLQHWDPCEEQIFTFHSAQQCPCPIKSTPLCAHCLAGVPGGLNS